MCWRREGVLKGDHDSSEKGNGGCGHDVLLRKIVDFIHLTLQVE